MPDNKYVFILCTPASGSTALWKFICTSSNVSYFDYEGQYIDSVKKYFGTEHPGNVFERWNPEKIIPWPLVEQEWNKQWKFDKPLLLEKSPSHVCRAKQIEDYFDNSFFIIMYRNPYAVCEGIKRRHFKDDKSINYKKVAEFWITAMECQKNSIQNLKKRIWFSYEDFTTNLYQTVERIKDFLPELSSFETGAKLKVFDKNLKVTNLNARQISRLSKSDIREINGVLSKNQSLLDHFGYKLIEPKRSIYITSFISKSFHLFEKVAKRLKIQGIN